MAAINKQMSEDIIRQLDAVLLARKTAGSLPLNATSYTAQLFAKGQDAILKKIAEESGELMMASKDLAYAKTADTLEYQKKLIAECADVWFHSLILLAHHGVSGADVLSELMRREGTSGVVEKQQRGVNS